MVSPIAGMAGTSDFQTNVHAENWRQGLLRQDPNGDAPLFGLTALMPSRKVDSHKFHWFTKSLPQSHFTVSDVYTDSGASSAYTGNGAAGDVLYIKAAAVDVERVVPGNGLALRPNNDVSASVLAKVIGEPVVDGANSVLPVRLLEADDNSISSPAVDLTAGDITALIEATIHPEGSTRPPARSYLEDELWNYVQTHRTPLDLTRRKALSSTRTVNPYAEAKRDAMIDHSKEWEWTMFFGERSLNTGINGKRETTTRGLVGWIRDQASANYRIFNLETGTAFAGKTWLEAGWRWLLESMELSFRYTGGGDERLVYCGGLALLQIQLAVQSTSSGFFIEPGEMEFGIKVRRLISPFGIWNLQRHPLLSEDPIYNSTMIVIEPRNLTYAYMTDTMFVPQTQKEFYNGPSGYDGIEEEFKTDAGLEVHFPNTFMFLGGIGTDNNQVL